MFLFVTEAELEKNSEKCRPPPSRDLQGERDPIGHPPNPYPLAEVIINTSSILNNCFDLTPF